MIPRPSNAGRVLGALPVQVLVSLVAGGIVAAAVGHKVGQVSFWTVTLAAGAIGFLIIFFVHNAFMTPRAAADIAQSDSDRLTYSITSAMRSSYAVCSNWITLWRSPNFRYYLHLDAATSLIAYSFRFDACLVRISTDSAHREEFFRYGQDLVREIASGENPVHKHRLRLLIYPQWVYEDYAEEMRQLIRSHSAARIPCLPLVSDLLYKSLDDAERESVRSVVAHLGQDAIDKAPPRSPIGARIARARLRVGIGRPEWSIVFPDMLLVDAGIGQEASTLWWYSRDGKVRASKNGDPAKRRAYSVFRTICQHAGTAMWDGYTAESLGGVAIPALPHRLGSEAFFARQHYEKWLKWILDHRGIEDAATELATWMDAEREALSEFVRGVCHGSGAPVPSGQGDPQLLDVGCGSGRHLMDVLNTSTALKAVGVDIIERKVSEANRLLRERGFVERAYVLMGDAATLDELGENEFDLAICMTNTLGNLPAEKQRPLLRSLGRLLKPGGRVLISVYSDASVNARLASYRAIGLDVHVKNRYIFALEGLRSQCFEPSELRSLLQDSGLELDEAPWHVGSIGLAAIGRRPPEEERPGARLPDAERLMQTVDQTTPLE